MTDTTLNRFLAYGTAASRGSFTPSVPTPASGPSQAYVWYETDTGLWWAYASGAWETIGGLGAVVSPASLGTSQNNYNPAGLSTCGVLRLTASAGINITGLTAPTPASNQTIVLTVLAASSTITLKSLSASSSAANQFGIASDLALAAGTSVLLSYDPTSSLWRVVGGASGGGGSGTVTSVTLASPNGTLAFGGTNPVTTSGTINLDVQIPLIPGGRLTLTSGTPVMTANATAQTTVYYDSYTHGYVPVWNGTQWNYLAIGSDEISMGLDAVTPHVASGSVYDVFGLNNSGSLVIAIGPAWSSTSSRGTGAGTTQLARKNGIYTNAVSLTHAWGGASGTTDYGAVSANQGTYLGTIYATANGQTGMNFNPAATAGGNGNILGLFNAYNRVPTIAYSRDSTANWTYTSSTWRVANAGGTGSGLNNRISFIDGLGQSACDAYYTVTASSGSTSDVAVVGINFNATTGAPASAGTISNASGPSGSISAVQRFLPTLGFNYCQAMEAQLIGGTGTWAAVVASTQQQMLSANVMM